MTGRDKFIYEICKALEDANILFGDAETSKQGVEKFVGLMKDFFKPKTGQEVHSK